MDKPHTINDLVELVSQYLNEENIKLITKAYDVAKSYHEGQYRKSGDPYIQHPLEVTYILATLKAGPNTLCAGLLHDVLEDTDMTKEEMAAEFNAEVAEIVDGVTKISKLKYRTKEKALASNHEKLLIAMSKDIRVILVKLVDRLHNMRTIEFQPEDKRKRIAKETLDLYAPLAHRLGMYRLKAELEDLSFKAIDPETYYEISSDIVSKKSEREDDIEAMRKLLVEMLEKNNIGNYQIKGRIKNIYSIYNKMVTKSKRLDDIYDLLALRVIVNSVGDCYHVLGLIHSIWTPLPKRFKDYIAVPKTNLYQSLHTTVVGAGGKIFEVQIRTYEMDNVAELGIAAHWAYKEGSGYSSEKEQKEIGQKLKWYKELGSILESSERDDPLDTLKDDLFSASVYVFTPTGDVYDFPNGSMPLDFAYRIHSEVGNKTVGAIVNGKIVPLSYKLQTGDVVEIKTSKSTSGPTESWLKLVKTAHARNKIKTYINKKQRDNFIAAGLAELEKVCKIKEYDIKLIDEKVVKEFFSKLNIKTFEDLCCEIGKGTISAQASLNRILCITDVKLDDAQALKQYSEDTMSSREHKSSKNDYGVYVDGLPKAQVKLGNCCQPVFGDTIYGYISKGYGIVIHREGCPNMLRSDQERFINVKWDLMFSGKVFNTTLKVFARDRRNLTADMINTLNYCNVTILSVTSTKTKNEECLAKFKLQVANLEDLNRAILALNKMPEMYSVERIFK
ncbi:MAG: bifunctional (p)ppGpp synthetase/guanosine-3',5'-bis(diphosphate) 3'-pyrophosphohydrolase [Bacilli bacterium]|nr:bifunctional (p)ppGpp synthetase/guanosine-3',5'-bis(diphosphate) 3'-pyrophosphohydrolase [Bacilli bacterium]